VPTIIREKRKGSHKRERRRGNVASVLRSKVAVLIRRFERLFRVNKVWKGRKRGPTFWRDKQHPMHSHPTSLLSKNYDLITKAWRVGT